MVGIARERTEAEMFIKRPRFIVLGVHRERSNAGDVRSLQRSLQRVFEQPGPETFALPGCRNGETGKEHDGNGVTGEALGQTLGSRGILDLANDQSIVADYGVTRQSAVGLRSTCLLVLERITCEKPVESFPAAIEFIDVVAALQLERGHSTLPRSNTLGSLKSLAKRRDGRGGADRAA